MNSIVRDDFNEPVRRALAARVGNRCSNPGCNALTSGPQFNTALAVNVGVAAHITGASPGGPRFDASLTSEQRSGPLNGIWLCQNCAKLIDNDLHAFTRPLLEEWKQRAEAHASNIVGKASPVLHTEPQRAHVLFVEIRLILPASGTEPVRIAFGLMNRGNLDAVVTLRDRTYFLTTDARQTVFAYLPSSAEEMAVAAIPSAIWRAEMRFDLRLGSEKLNALRSGSARLFFYARGEYRDTAGQSYPLPFAEMYDATFPGNLVAPPTDVIFE